MNDVDAACKLLHDGYECAIIDSRAENEECVPWNTPYNSSTGMGGNNLVDECTTSNLNSKCGERACIIESQFVSTLISQYMKGFQIDPAYKHSTGFDIESGCPTKSNSRESEKSCCGYYPYRHPYKTYGDERKCCGLKTYDSKLLECCNDGKARGSC